MALERVIAHHANKVAFEFITQSNEKQSLTYQELFDKSQRIAAYLQEHAKVGDRVLLSYLPGLDFITGFVACLYAGLVAVPTYPLRSNHHAKRFLALLDDCQPKLICGTKESLKIMQQQEEFAGYYYINTDEIKDFCVSAWTQPLIKPDTLAFLQYTSGSTGSPKGVMVNHANILSNEEMIHSCAQMGVNDTSVLWIPMQHDMGLIGGLLYTLYTGMMEVFMAPAMFLSHPFLWLKSISDYQARGGVAPNFGYELCVEKIEEVQLEFLNLSCWRLALNGSEPIRKKTLDEFVKKFGRCGFNKKAFVPCYGMAETTLMVSSKPYNTIYVTHPFEQSVAISSGHVYQDYTIKVVNPETKKVCSEGQVGELWLHGPSVAQGYWQKKQATEEEFHAHLNGDNRAYFRTGDLGFLKKRELYVTGRLKDLIILQGRNLYPQDVERVVEQSHEAIRKSCVAAFSVEVQQQERLVVVAEIERIHRKTDFAPVFQAIRKALVEELEVIPYSIQLLAPAQTLKTTSGKIQRKATKKAHLEQSLVTLAADDLAITACSKIPTYAALEEVIMQILKKVLAVEQIDRTARFSELGGTSLQAVLFHEQLQTYLGDLLELSPSIIFDYPSIEKLSNFIYAHLTGQEEQSTAYTRRISFADNPIAIVGMACRFPGQSTNPEAFWRLLSEGRDGICEVPKTRWNWHEYESELANHQGGFIDRIEWFAPEFFNISPREAISMDPQQRLLLETTWEAFERACIDLSTLSESDTGVFVGATTHEYSDLLVKNQQKGSYVAIGNSSSALAGRISYTFGLQGPCLSIDTACSSSLVALAEACEHLQLGETSLAIVAGVNALITPEGFIQLSHANMLSKKGYCQVFSDEADGYVRGEGCGVVLVKRLNDALRDNNRILGVIKSAVVNQDGASSGFTVPNGAAQEKLIRQALTDAKLSPKDIDYFEAHGTGTVLGDPMETHAIEQVFVHSHEPNNPLILGSVKANVGHLEAAAGIVGLTKILLSLEHESIPPQIHVNNLNPKINLQHIPAQVPLSQVPWPYQPGHLRRAGISSFGFTGTNVHVIVEEAPPKKKACTSKSTLLKEHLFVLSAKSKKSLEDLIQAYVGFLDTTEECLDDICYTAAVGRCHFSWRIAVSANSKEELIKTLSKTSLTIKEVSCSEAFIDSTDLHELSGAYIAGKKIDWNHYYEPYLKALCKVRLPTYCFSRQHYWIDIKRGQDVAYGPRVHELLGSRLPGSGEEVRFYNVLDLEAQNYLHAHQVFGSILMPGAAFIESALAVGKWVKGGFPICVTEMYLQRPLVLIENKKCNYVVRVKPHALDYEGVIESQQVGGEWEEHAHFQLHFDSKANYSIIDLNACKADKSQYDLTKVYKQFNKMGLNYGLEFQVINEVWLGKEGLLAHLVLSEGISINHYVVHPTILDGALQAVGLLLTQQKTYIPTSIERFTCYQPVGGNVWVDVGHFDEEVDYIKANLSFYNQTGVLLAELKGFKARAVNKAQLLKVLHTQEETPVYAEALDDYVPPMFVPTDTNVYVCSNETCTNAFPQALQLLHNEDAAGKHLILLYSGVLADLFVLTQKRIKESPLSMTLVVREDNPYTQAALGFWRSVRNEIGTNLPMYFIACKSLHEVEPFIHSIVQNRLAEPEIKVMDGRYFVPRFYREANALAKENKLPLPHHGEYLASKGGIDSIYWAPREEHPLDNHALRIRIKATALNFRDVLNAMNLYPGEAGDMGYEACGEVIAKGSAVKDITLGSNVVMMGTGLFGTEVVVSETDVYMLPKTLSIQEGASVPIVYLTANYALNHLAKLQQKQKVLIHAATGGVGLAAIAFAKRAGAEIYATASQEKQAYLKAQGITYVYDSRSTDFAAQINKDTQNQGVDVVLNSLTSEGFIEASLSCLKKEGVFLEIGKLNVKSQEEMKLLRPDVLYHLIAMDVRMQEESYQVHNELQWIMEQFTIGELNPLPLHEFAIQDCIHALHFLQQAKHIGKVVLTYPQPFTYKDDATYLITGGAGGLGLALAEHLIVHGVRHLVLTSRRKASDDLNAWIGTQEEAGIEVYHEAVDVTDESSLADLIGSINQSNYPLKGVFHAAGVLHDGLLANLSLDDLHEVWDPKVLGATYLDQLTKNLDLDCFVLFSSIASILGSPGQSNYAAANGYLDGLARARTVKGLAALSINWGPFAEVGMAAHLAQYHRAQGLTPLEKHSAFAVMDEHLNQNEAQISVLRMDWDKQSAQPYLSHLTTKHTDEGDWMQLLLETNPAQHEAVLTWLVKQILAEVLLIDVSLVDAQKGFFDMGMDSLMAVELKNKIQVAIGDKYRLNVSIIFEQHNLQNLVDYLYSFLKLGTNDFNHKETDTPEIKSVPHRDIEKAQSLLTPDIKDGFEIFEELNPDLLFCLERHASTQADRIACIFLQGSSIEEITYNQLVDQAKLYASFLQERGLKTGDRVLITLPQTMSLVVVFLGVLYAGGVAVLANPPIFANQAKRTFLIISDAEPSYVIANTATIKVLQKYSREYAGEYIELTQLQHHQRKLAGRKLQKSDIAFLQYTSGSTGNPKGVIIDHGNLSANLNYFATSDHVQMNSKVVSWLPLTHDMGLIGTFLSTLYIGAQLIFMTPVEFLSRPLIWLETITKYRATHTCAPNFAYALCVNEAHKLSSIDHLDLSSLITMGCGSEAVRSETMRQFCETFKSVNLNPDTILPGYGMAEATLLITREKHGNFTVWNPAHGELDDTTYNKNGLVSCGFRYSNEEVVIVDIDKYCEKNHGEIGEIWVRGPSISRGYWNKPDETQKTFAAYLADGRGPFLRTGDLGLINESKQLFFVGRIKDVIIIHGKNYAPQDIEETIERCSPLLLPNQVLAFSIEKENEEKLVCVLELREQLSEQEKEVLNQEIKRKVFLEHSVAVFDIRMCLSGGIPKTTSGKLQRQLCKKKYLDEDYS